MLGVSYISVSGVDATALAERIRSKLPLDDIPKLTARITADPDWNVMIDTLYRTAVVALPDYDPQAFALLRSGLNHPNELVRRAALVAVSITGWESFIPALDEISQHDPESAVRDQAARIRDALKTTP